MLKGRGMVRLNDMSDKGFVFRTKLPLGILKRVIMPPKGLATITLTFTGIALTDCLDDHFKRAVVQ
jgi:hypothetical protein